MFILSRCFITYCHNINFGEIKFGPRRPPDMPDISRFHFAHTICRRGSFAPTEIRNPKHRLRKSRQFSPPPCRFQPVQNLRDLRKRVRSRKTSEKLDQKTKETREERPRDGAGEAEGGGGALLASSCNLRNEGAPPLPRPPPPIPRPLFSCLLCLLIKFFGGFP